MIQRIENLIATGNFDEAVPLTLTALEDPDVHAAWEREPDSSVSKMATSGVFVEVLAYLGRNGEAARWLRPWMEEHGRVRLPAATARLRLQAVEYAYGLRHFADSENLATDIFHSYDQAGDEWSAGEAAYYVARSCMRLHRLDDTYKWCDRALERFSAARDVERDAVHWRTGLGLLVSGFAGALAGDISARHKLLSARTLLASSGDTLARAHAEHSLGAVYRSMDNDLPRAQNRFAAARVWYEQVGNPIHLARVSTNIGRTYLDALDWEEAHDQLHRALEDATNIKEEKSRRRQRAETLVYVSWLWMQGPRSDLARAEQEATRALDDARAVSESITVEALLALGRGQLLARRLSEARRSFEEALRIAETIGITKLLVNAKLCLADVLSMSGSADLAKGLEYWRSAEAMLASLHSRYLSKKAAGIHEQVKSRRDVWLVSKADILTGGEAGNRFRQLGESLDRWMIERLEEEHQLTMSERARRLGVTPSGYLQKRRSLKIGGQ